MVAPSEFARLALCHGTVASVSDPHEIANVLGIEGVRFMVENGKSIPFKFCFGAPSCVPATTFESAGAFLDPDAVEVLLKCDDIGYLSEMMNFPGVINEDPQVMAKIARAKAHGKPVDGHAPGLRGASLQKYVAAGISTDHETFQYDEGAEKLSLGMKLLIREGSAAKNFDTLSPFILTHTDQCMFCSDDKHPDDLVAGHINELVKRSIRMGADIMTTLRCASVNPVLHYGLDVGLLKTGDPADFIEVDDLERLDVLRTFINGRIVAEKGKPLLEHRSEAPRNNFKAGRKSPDEFAVLKRGASIHVIEVIGGQVFTGSNISTPKANGEYVVSDVEQDLLKLTVVNRYSDVPPAVAFVRNFGLKRGAIASSVAHDSHNIVAVGVADRDICEAVNLLVDHGGGLSVVHDNIREVLPLPMAGLMSTGDGFTVARNYSRLDHIAKQLGSFLNAPFMTLSFMALLVIPKLKLSDKGLFDGETFRIIDLFI